MPALEPFHIRLQKRIAECEAKSERYLAQKKKNCPYNPEKARIYRQRHAAHYTYHSALRHARKKQATPLWADLKTIKRIYETCPEGYHVDHIIPLTHPQVCGLHCQANLQHLPATENIRKSNSF